MSNENLKSGLLLYQRIIKRLFDLLVSVFAISFLWWIILIAYLVTLFDLRENAFFIQDRVGKNHKLFKIIKIKTISNKLQLTPQKRISKIGHFLRKYKIDELPQLINVIIGDMSLVGPRPDLPIVIHQYTNSNKINFILSVKPGITGPASIIFINEYDTLSNKNQRYFFNEKYLFNKKVGININYIKNWSFKKDLQYILKTLSIIFYEKF